MKSDLRVASTYDHLIDVDDSEEKNRKAMLQSISRSRIKVKCLGINLVNLKYDSHFLEIEMLTETL